MPGTDFSKTRMSLSFLQARHASPCLDCLQVPPRGVRFADAVEHRAVLGVDIDAEGVLPCEARRAYVVDKNRHEQDIVVGHQVGPSGPVQAQSLSLDTSPSSSLRLPP